MKKIILRFIPILILASCDDDDPIRKTGCSAPIYIFSSPQADTYSFNIRIVSSMHIAVNPDAGDVRDSFRQMKNLWKFYIKKNNDPATEFSALDVSFQAAPSAGAGWTEYTFTGPLNLAEGDNVRIYAEEQANIYTAMTIWTAAGVKYDPLNGSSTVFENQTGYATPSYINVSANSIYPNIELEGMAECVYVFGQF